MIVVQLLGRKYLVNEDKKFIVKEIPKSLNEGDIIETSGYTVEGSDIREKQITLRAVKILKTKIVILKKKRRKRYKCKKGYNQLTGYFSIDTIKDKI